MGDEVAFFSSFSPLPQHGDSARGRRRHEFPLCSFSPFSFLLRPVEIARMVPFAVMLFPFFFFFPFGGNPDGDFAGTPHFPFPLAWYWSW